MEAGDWVYSRYRQRHKPKKNAYLDVQIMGLGDVAKFTHQVLRAGKGKAWGHYGFHP